MVGTVQMVIRGAVVNHARQEFEKGWKFAETHWYCNDCGFVSSVDVQKEDVTAETGICRCGNEIEKTAF